jgi:Anti-sigma factor NepR
MRSTLLNGGGKTMSPERKDAQAGGGLTERQAPVSDKAAGTQQEQNERLVRQRALSDSLRTIFNDIAQEKVPSGMLNLLDELEQKGDKK